MWYGIKQPPATVWRWAAWKCLGWPPARLWILADRTVGNSMASNMASKAKAATIMHALNKGRGRAALRVSRGISNTAINRALTTISLQADPVSRVITL